MGWLDVLGTPKRGLDYLASAAGQALAGNDPLSALGIDSQGNVTAPTIGETAASPITNPVANRIVRSAVDTASDPVNLLSAATAPAQAMSMGAVAKQTAKRVATNEGLRQMRKRMENQKDIADAVTKALNPWSGTPENAGELGDYVLAGQATGAALPKRATQGLDEWQRGLYHRFFGNPYAADQADALQQ